ncbi:hypothetical protein LAZ67_21001626 [Cordylochernes scorpioides]|uniref:DUF5641 domain-containing protein n=1 Tax=Cordylochernes scorpioides TaxID=51811 RepID=A0ABY6LNY5_9ARAC|nr:hypothetical protein LAZ67_21001626 [Cordylochernes scorpioides]
METSKDSMNLKILKRSRTPRRTIFTKEINKTLEELKGVSPDECLLMEKREFIVQYYQQIKEYDAKIEMEMIGTEEYDEKAVMKELESTEHYEKMYSAVLIRINKILEAKTEEKRAMSEARCEGIRRALLRLPKMELPCFDGDLEGWISWWSRFNRIHEDKDLDDDEKMHYLVQAMIPGSRAHRLLGAYTHTWKNYENAIGALKGRFGDKKLLIELYLRKLINLVVFNARRQSANLDRLYDEISAYLQYLESLSIPSEYLEVFLFPLVESCLPTQILQVWQRTPEAGYGRDDEHDVEQGKGERLKALMGFLRAEMKAQQRISFSRIGVGENNPKYNFPSRPSHFNKNNGPRAAQLMVSRNENSKGLFLSPNYERKTKCIFCDGMGHENWICFKIGRMTREEQLKKMSDAGVCFKCLKGNHLGRHCRRKIIFQNCGGPHYLIFCRGNNSRRDSFSENGGSSKERKNNSSVQNQKFTVLLTQSCASEVLLMTVRAKICSSETSKIINVLLDSGSQYSFIKESLAEELGLEKLEERKLTKCLFGGRQTREEKHSLYSFSITNILKEETVQLKAMDQRMICDRVPILTAGTWMRDLDKKGVTIIRRKNVETSEIDLLLGAENLSKIWTDKLVYLEDGLTAINTNIGWSIFGEISLREGLASEYVSPVFLTMSHKIKDLWDLEMLGVRDSKRLERCVNKLTTQERLEDYSKIFTEWEQENIIERIHDDNKTVGHYSPHRPVFKETNKTTPIRPVYDASCRTVKVMSLNDCLETGPNLLEHIPNVIIRFRENKIRISADIRKAFQMIEVNPEDRKYLKFIWSNIGGSVLTFQHTRVVFGLTSSPFLLGAVIEHHLKSVTDENYYVAQRLLRSFYVDNCLTSLNKESDIVHFKEKASEIMNRAGMELRQWETTETFNPRERNDTKVLGLLWNRKTDTLNCMINLEILPSVITRRVILSLVQKLFDPLGFYSPVMITPKILLQKHGLAQNRVDEIKRTTKVSNWRFVPGLENPADLPSRGSKFGQFLRSKWWEGPDWLRLSREFWPSEEPIIDETEVLKEQRKTTLVEIVIKPITHGMFKRFSEFQSNVRLYSAKPGSVETAPLPTNRIHLGKPFQVTGIDLFGPLLLRNNTKTWVALFTCGVYRAVHMEVIQGLDTPSFLMALRRFISRRGRPQGGFWERLIRIIKGIIKRMLGNKKLNFVQLETQICHVEAIINERPLTYMSEDSDDFRPLTPALFLQVNDDNTFPELDHICRRNLVEKYKNLQTLKEELKMRFYKEFLGELVQKKEDSDTRAITAGEVVYVGNDSQKRINWPLGLVEKVYPGEDGNCRVAKVRIRSGEIVRPIQRPFPLEILVHFSDMEACGVQDLSKDSSSLGNNDK